MTVTRRNIKRHDGDDEKYNKNISAKVHGAKPAKLIYHLIMLLTTSLCNAKEHVAKSEDILLGTTKGKPAEVQGNYHNFDQILAERKKYCRLKSQRKSATF